MLRWREEDEDLFVILAYADEHPPTTTTAPPQQALQQIIGLQFEGKIKGFQTTQEILGLYGSISIQGVFGMEGQIQAGSPIWMPCGNGLPITWTYTEQDRTTPIDLSTVEDIIFTARVSNNPTAPLILQKSLLGGTISIVDHAAGVASISFAESDTVSFPPGRYYYSIKVIFTSGGTPDHPTAGLFTLTPHT